jgi:glycosyltransferase involved in cell wall biosynthesis
VISQVTVIVPVKNDATRLRVLLRSLSLQTINHEVIVVDNGSTDPTVADALEAGVRVLVFPGIRVGALRNRGCAESLGPVVAFVDSDHEVPEDWLERGVSVLLGAADAEIVACGAHYLPPSDGTWVQRCWAIHRLRGKDRTDVDWLGSGNLFVKREAFNAIGGFREDLVAAEDVDLCHRLRLKGGRILLDKQIRNIHHGEPKTLRDFFKKEYWRGSSGVKAWVSQGFPWRDLPSFIWPAWHLVIGLMLTIAGLYALFSLDTFTVYLFGTLALLWVIPSLLLSVKTCSGVSEMRFFPQLSVLYFVYGIARAAALFKS